MYIMAEAQFLDRKAKKGEAWKKARSEGRTKGQGRKKKARQWHEEKGYEISAAFVARLAG